MVYLQQLGMKKNKTRENLRNFSMGAKKDSNREILAIRQEPQTFMHLLYTFVVLSNGNWRCLLSE